MTKARDIADFKFENIVDTGTEGTRVATGTTAERGSTTGQWRYNTTTGFFEGRNTDGTYSTLEPTPTIISTDITEIDTATGGNITIRVTGTNFTSGGTIKFIANDGSEITASTSTYINASNYDAVVARSSFSNALEPYDVRFISASGLQATLDDNINVDNAPSWNTTSGTLATISDQATGTHTTLSATDPDGDTVSYSDTTGNLTSAGLSLDSSTGVISGDPTDVSSSTTVSFTGRATAGSKTTDRSFNIIIDPYRTVQFAVLGAGGGGGAQDSNYQTGSDENQGEGGCGSLITATYAIKLGTNLYYYIGQGGTGGVNTSVGTGGTYGGSGGYSSTSDGVAGGGGGDLVGLFMANSISQANALLIAGSGGGGAGRPAGGGNDECNGGGGIPNADGRGNDGTLGQESNNQSNTDYADGGQKNNGGSAQGSLSGTTAGNSGTALNGGDANYRAGAWGGGGGGGAGLYGGAGGRSEDSWGGSGGGAGSSFIRGLITDYTNTDLNNNFATGITYSTGAFTIQAYGHTGGALSGNTTGSSNRGYNGQNSYSMRDPASFSTYIGSLTLSDYGYGGIDGRNDTQGQQGKQGIIAYKIGTGSWQQLTTTGTLTGLTIS
jgi:hypothetical protein